MLDLLISSTARVKVITLFIMEADRSFHQREISRRTGVHLQAVQREMSRLEKFGLITKRPEGNRAMYEVNRNFFLFPELKGMIFKTAGLGSIIKEQIKTEAGIEVAFIYGSYAKNDENAKSDIDLFIVGDIPAKKLSAVLRKVQKQTMREINYVIFPRAELKRRIKAKNNFIMNVLKEPKIFIKGDENDIR